VNAVMNLSALHEHHNDYYAMDMATHFTENVLTFRHRAYCILGQTFHYSLENAFYIFNQQIYFII